MSLIFAKTHQHIHPWKGSMIQTRTLIARCVGEVRLGCQNNINDFSENNKCVELFDQHNYTFYSVCHCISFISNVRVWSVNIKLVSNSKQIVEPYEVADIMFYLSIYFHTLFMCKYYSLLI